MSDLQHKISEAIRDYYPDSHHHCDGYLVIGRDRFIERLELGAQRIFGVTEDQAVGSSLKLFLPERMSEPIHDRLIDGEFLRIEQALNEKTTYVGRNMAEKDGKPQFVDARNFQGEPISIGIEFEPLFIDQEPFLIAFLYKNPKQHTDMAITATKESALVIETARLNLGLQAVDAAGSRFSRVFIWLVNTAGFPKQIAFIFLLTISGLFLYGASSFIYIRFLSPKPELQQFEFGPPPTGDNVEKSRTSSDDRP